MTLGATTDELLPTEAPSAEELARWQLLPREKQVSRLEEATHQSFTSDISTRDIDEITDSVEERKNERNERLSSLLRGSQ